MILTAETATAARAGRPSSACGAARAFSRPRRPPAGLTTSTRLHVRGGGGADSSPALHSPRRWSRQRRHRRGTYPSALTITSSAPPIRARRAGRSTRSRHGHGRDRLRQIWTEDGTSESERPGQLFYTTAIPKPARPTVRVVPTAKLNGSVSDTASLGAALSNTWSKVSPGRHLRDPKSAHDRTMSEQAYYGLPERADSQLAPARADVTVSGDPCRPPSRRPRPDH